MTTLGQAEPERALRAGRRKRRRRQQRLDKRLARLQLLLAARSFATAGGGAVDPQAVGRMVAHFLTDRRADRTAPTGPAQAGRDRVEAPQTSAARPLSAEPETAADDQNDGPLSCGQSLNQRQPWALPHHPIIVLFRPEIPPNAGSVARLCAAFRMPLIIVGPIRFELSTKAFRRAGLDYWPWVDLTYYGSWDAFLAAARHRRLVFIETDGTNEVASFAFAPGDALVFGPETSGLPAEIMAQQTSGACASVRIPMWQEHVRSINLANAVAIAASHALAHAPPPPALIGATVP